MICIICGERIGSEFPIPVSRIEFTPRVPTVPTLTQDRLGLTVLQDRLCCQSCYKKNQDNDFKAIQEVGQIPRT